MAKKASKIIWTKIDEAPALATYSLLPIVNAFTQAAGVKVETKDISLAGRIIANFPDNLNEEQKIPDYLKQLGQLALKPEANIIKLPNISASIPQLKEAIKELQQKGYNIPDYPDEPKTEEDKNLLERFAKVLGSAVNPVLRQGNSDRRAADSVKKFAKMNPHKMMKPWENNSKTHVAYMSDNDFYGNEKSITLDEKRILKIEFIDKKGNKNILKNNLDCEQGEIIDGTFLSVKTLRDFYQNQIEDAKEKGVLFSLHLKATMMKVSDPILFGHAVYIFYKEVFDKYQDTFNKIGINYNYGLADIYKKIENIDDNLKEKIKSDIKKVTKERPDLAMVDSDKGITNLHVPNNIIIDASMPVLIRDGGKMWSPQGNLKQTKAIIPDRSYSTIYQQVIDDCKKNGQFNPATMGSVSNIGLMAQKAEEYGSHSTTFEIPSKGKVQVVDDQNNVLIEHYVEKGDIWRMSRVKDLPVKDWVKLALKRSKQTRQPAVFWLDKNRSHDKEILKKVNICLKNHNNQNAEIKILAPDEAMKFTLERTRAGKDTISVTGNVLRDYLTDLFPILELGTSARMMSIVPLLAGGGLFETGAGGSAPKHVKQFINQGHLRWDSLGEFLALSVSLQHLGKKYKNNRALILADTLDKAVGKYLENRKNPSRKPGELDNRGSHFYLAMYWAQLIAEQTDDAVLKAKFSTIAKDFIDNKKNILEQIAQVEGKPTDIGGYYLPDKNKTENAMRPSKKLNEIITFMKEFISVE